MDNMHMSPALCILPTQCIYYMFLMDVVINSDYLLMLLVLIGLLTDTVYVLRELNLYLFRDNFDTQFSLITELLFPSCMAQQLNSHRLTCTSQTSTLPSGYLYCKDERA